MQTEFTFPTQNAATVNRLGYGCMQLTGPGVWGDSPRRELAKKVLRAAVETGINFFDTADSYGPYTNEVLLQETLAPFYDRVVIATKGGFERSGPRKWKINGHPEHIRKAIEGSLTRLKTEQLDLWQLHRIDPDIPLEETLGPVADAVQQGKIRAVGLSEVSVAEIERAKRVVPIASVQNLYNIANRQWEEVLDYTTAHGMAFIPWYPLAAGPSGLGQAISAIALRHNAAPAQIALAWLFHRAPNILLIPGTHSVVHLKENAAAPALRLTEDDLSAISRALLSGQEQAGYL